MNFTRLLTAKLYMQHSYDKSACYDVLHLLFFVAYQLLNNYSLFEGSNNKQY